MTETSIQESSNTSDVFAPENERFVHWYKASELNLAMNIAKSRERFRWSVGYLGLISAGTCMYWAKTLKFPLPMLLPISAVTMYTSWEYDLGYGSRLNRLSREADSIITKERYKYFGKY
ncbi:plasminogen receptor [Acrasis kona]|uniref:Plasminogen receptor n=1 Tax=Acrasis kona TaxID=1008807 RepID=A0AAW2YX62_9EUKA